MMTPDTVCRCYTDGTYRLTLFGDSPESELLHLFRILHFLGAPAGFQVNWWRFPADRVVAGGKFPTRAEVNGGWAYRGSTEVFLFRIEEWDRVLLHECIHALSWDATIVDGTQNCLEQSVGGGSISSALFEAATELNAEWMWSIIHAPVDDVTGQTWLTQRAWQDQQAIAILARAPRVWAEDTNVFAYYVLKAVLAHDIQEFLIEWLAGTLNSERWCDMWTSKRESMIAASRGVDTTAPLSMRMTNPTIGHQNSS